MLLNQEKKSKSRRLNKQVFSLVLIICGLTALETQAEPEAMPDFLSDMVSEVSGALSKAIAIKTQKADQAELWLFDSQNNAWQNIAQETTLSPDFPIGHKDGFVFWLSSDRQKAYAYNPEEDIFLEEEVDSFDPAKGQRAKINFVGVDWELVVDADNFYFFSRQTGEVFSDGDSAVLEEVRQQFGFDDFLSKANLSDLGFSVEPAEEYGE